jgi:hypothetical protein
VTPDQRDKLLDLHRAAVRAAEAFNAGYGRAVDMHDADDAFRAYLFSLDVTA